MKDVNTYKGFSMFNDIADKALRIRNRAVVLANIAESNVKDRLITPKGASLVLGYFSKVQAEEREEVKEQFKSTMHQRGFKLV